MKQSDTSLTIHLYRKDEVLAALRMAIISKELSEAVYWGVELYNSDMQSDGLELLQNIWITHIGLSSWWILDSILKVYETGEMDRNDWVSLLVACIGTKSHDSTVFHLLLRGALTLHTWKPAFPHSIQYTSIENALKDCLSRGKLLDAWLLGRALSLEQQWEILKAIGKEKGRLEQLERIRSLSSLSSNEILASSYVCVYMDEVSWIVSQAPINSIIPEHMKDAIDAFESTVSIRGARIFSPPSLSLVHMTLRSSQASHITSESDIQKNLVSQLCESTYWQTILCQYMNLEKKTWISDLKKEEFYDTYFPWVTDDIPDEWPLESRQMSHGYGLGLSEESARISYIKNILDTTKPLELWQSSFKGRVDCTMEWDSIYDDNRKQIHGFLCGLLPMEPIKKIFEIS